MPTPTPERSPWPARVAGPLALIVILAALAPLWFAAASCTDEAPCAIGIGLRSGHDSAFHAVTTRAVARALEAGSGTPLLFGLGPRYPEWVDSLQGGLGGPVFAIYPPVATFVAASIEWLLGVDTTVALRVGLTLSVLLAFASFHGAARWLGASSVTALLAATLYAAGPHFLTDLHVRFAMATLWAYVWFPWIVAGSWRVLCRGGTTAWVLSIVATAGLWCTHVVSGVLLAAAAAPALIAYSLSAMRSARGRDHRRGASTLRGLFRWSVAITLSLPLAAIFLLPMVAARGHVELEWIQASEHGDFRRNFLFSDEVAAGFSEAAIKPWMESLALVQLGAGLVLALLLAVSTKAPEASRQTRRLALLAGVTMIWVFLLQTPISAPLWQFTPLAWAQFPWRFAGLQGLLLCLLVALTMANSSRARPASDDRADLRRPRRASGWVGASLAAALLALGFWSVRPFDVGLRGGAAEIDRRAPDFWVPEYLPRGWMTDRDPEPGQRFNWLLADGQMRSLEDSPGRWRFELEATTATRFVGPFAFPGLRSELDGESVESAVSDDRRLEIAIPAGKHDLVIHYRAPWRRTGLLITLGTLFGLVPLRRALNRRKADPRAR